MNQVNEEEWRPSGENNRCHIPPWQVRSEIKRAQREYGRR